jgi:hypothetical protein
MSRGLTVQLTPVEINHLITLLGDAIREGSYFGERTWLSSMSAAELNARDAYLELQFGAVLEAAHREGYQAALREVRERLKAELPTSFHLLRWLDTALGAEGKEKV